MTALIAMTDRLVAVSGGRAARMWSSQGAVLGFVLLAVFSISLTAIGYFVPKANWDTLAYMASAYEEPGMSAEEIHAHAYDTMRQGVSEGDFVVLTEDRAYRVRQYADPEAFMTMLGFYRVKVLYVETISLLSRLMNPLQAIHLIAALSAGAVGFLSIAWLWRYNALSMAPLAMAVLMLSGIGVLGRVGTPDAYATVFFVAGMLAFVAKRELLVAVLLFAAFLVRPDNIAYFGVLFVVSIFMRSFSWGAVAAFVASAIVYVPITHAADHPGWWIQMWFTHVEYVGTLEGFDPAFSLLVYLKIVARVVARSLFEQQWAAVMIVACAVWWQMARNLVPMSRRESTVLVATVLAIAAKFVVFPLHETRFYAGYLVVFGLVLVCAAARIPFDWPVRARAGVSDGAA